MKKDVDEMARMLEAYLAFARGDSGETSSPTDMAAFLDELKAEGERNGHRTSVAFHGQPIVTVRPAAFKRCVGNLVSNAARHAHSISITGHRDHRWLTVTVDDDGPGIPAAMREEVFKPFLRLDDARNQDEGGTGLGLAIARDIARSHGGDITLSDSPMGGLRATVQSAGVAPATPPRSLLRAIVAAPRAAGRRGVRASRFRNPAEIVEQAGPALAARQRAVERGERARLAGIVVMRPRCAAPRRTATPAPARAPCPSVRTPRCRRRSASIASSARRAR